MVIKIGTIEPVIKYINFSLTLLRKTKLTEQINIILYIQNNKPIFCFVSINNDVAILLE